MSDYIGDFPAGVTFRKTFNTGDAAVLYALAGSPVVSVYKDGDNGEVTTGVTLNVSLDGRTGINEIVVDMSNAFYATGKDFRAVITTGTVNGKSAVGYEICSWSIENRTNQGVGVQGFGDLGVYILTHSGGIAPLFTTTFNGLPAALTGGVVSIYKKGSTTEFGSYAVTSGYDSRIGLNEFSVANFNDVFFVAGDYTFVLTAGTVNGRSVAGTVIGTMALARVADANLVTWRGSTPRMLLSDGSVVAIEAISAELTILSASGASATILEDTVALGYGQNHYSWTHVLMTTGVAKGRPFKLTGKTVNGFVPGTAGTSTFQLDRPWNSGGVASAPVPQTGDKFVFCRDDQWDVDTESSAIRAGVMSVETKLMSALALATVTSGVAQGGVLNGPYGASIQLAAGEAGAIVAGQILFCTSGPGAGQTGHVTSWNPTTKWAGISTATEWTVTPTGSTGYSVFNYSALAKRHDGTAIPTVEEIEDAVLDAPEAEHAGAGTVGAAITTAKSNSTTMLNRLGGWAGSGVNTLLGAFRALMNKGAGVATPTDITAGGGTFNNTTDSTEAIRDKADTISGGGGDSAFTPEDVEQIRHRLSLDGDSEVPAGGAFTMLDIKGVTDRLAGGAVRFRDAVSSEGQLIKLVPGDDYNDVTNDMLCWTGENWPDLSHVDTEIRFSIRDRETDALVFTTDEGQVVDGADPQEVRVPLDREDTEDLVPGRKYIFDVEAAIPGDGGPFIKTLVTGVVAALTPATRGGS